MKGITPVIAVILLLLITIAMVGFAFVWFGRVVQSAGNSTQQNLEAFQSQTAKRIAIENVDGPNRMVYIRNIGTQSISQNDLVIYINGSFKGNPTCGNIAPGSVQGCQWTSVAPNWCVDTGSVRVTAPGNEDERPC